MTREQAKDMLARASESVRQLNRRLAIEIPYPHENQTHRQVSGSKPKQVVCHEPLAKGKAEASRAPRITVSITSFRARLLDPDNLCPKSLVDGLRYSGLIPDDRPQDIELLVKQEKCSKDEERTEIEIELPD